MRRGVSEEGGRSAGHEKENDLGTAKRHKRARKERRRGWRAEGVYIVGMLSVFWELVLPLWLRGVALDRFAGEGELGDAEDDYIEKLG